MPTDDTYLYTILGCVGVVLLIILFWWIMYKLLSKRSRVPIHLSATTYFKAFLLNAIVITIAIAVTTIINNILQDKTNEWNLDKPCHYWLVGLGVNKFSNMGWFSIILTICPNNNCWAVFWCCN